MKPFPMNEYREPGETEDTVITYDSDADAFSYRRVGKDGQILAQGQITRQDDEELYDDLAKNTGLLQSGVPLTPDQIDERRSRRPLENQAGEQ